MLKKKKKFFNKAPFPPQHPPTPPPPLPPLINQTRVTVTNNDYALHEHIKRKRQNIARPKPFCRPWEPACCGPSSSGSWGRRSGWRRPRRWWPPCRRWFPAAGTPPSPPAASPRPGSPLWRRSAAPTTRSEKPWKHRGFYTSFHHPTPVLKHHWNTAGFTDLFTTRHPFWNTIETAGFRCLFTTHWFFRALDRKTT